MWHKPARFEKESTSILSKPNNFYSLEVVDRVSETQLQVSNRIETWSTMQRQTAVAAHFSSEQLLLFEKKIYLTITEILSQNYFIDFSGILFALKLAWRQSQQHKGYPLSVNSEAHFMTFCKHFLLLRGCNWKFILKILQSLKNHFSLVGRKGVSCTHPPEINL